MGRLLAIGLLLLVGCGEAAPPPTSVCADPRPPAASAPSFDTGNELGTSVGATVHVGTRRAGSGEATGFVHAALRQVIVPVLHDLVAEEGSCRQWLAPGYNCGLGSCQNGQICVGPDTCGDAPPGAGAGALEVQAGDAHTSVADSGLGIYFGQLDDAAGCGTVSVSVPGADFPAFSLSAPQVPPLQVIAVDQLRLVEGQPMTVRWTPADPSTRVRVTLRADHGAHGLLWSSVVECDAPDAAGQVTVPAGMVDRHIQELSCGECPFSSITRYRRVAGKADATFVELLVEDETTAYVTNY